MEGGVWPRILASGDFSCFPVSSPLSTFPQGDEAHQAGGTVRVPLHAGSFEPERKILAHGLSRPGADVQPLGDRLSVLHHFRPPHEVVPLPP